MDIGSSQLRPLSIAMLILGFATMITGIILTRGGRPGYAVVVPGLFLVILGIAFLGQSKK